MEQKIVRDMIARAWAGEVIPNLSGLIAIPALSPAFDVGWAATGYLRAAVDHVASWVRARDIAAGCEVVELPGRSPVLLIDVPPTAGAAGRGTALLYGHLDKQPALTEWSTGLGPWQPVLRDGRLYGRGSVDDGYSGYAALTALEAVRAAGGEHARAVILLETGEESGSPDLPAYLHHLARRLGDVNLVICLDGGGGTDYKRLWLTSSLRGGVTATVTVRVLESGVHSGIAGGIVPSSFRIMRQLLNRVEDPATGEVLLPEMNVPVPERRRADAEAFAALDPDAVGRGIPFVRGMAAAAPELAELILNNTWRPALSVIGGDGLPESRLAPAVLRPATSLRLSFRTPPGVEAAVAREALERALTIDVPYGAQIKVSDWTLFNGWSAPEPSTWLATALDGLTGPVFSEAYRQLGVGGGIPFMEMLGRRYADADFVITGALGTDSNMHVADEWLNIEYAEQVTAAVAVILDAHASRLSISRRSPFTKLLNYGGRNGPRRAADLPPYPSSRAHRPSLRQRARLPGAQAAHCPESTSGLRPDDAA
jgi:acetylornithine deacetylase/succinyl-diaminopimelate desuccinylase-like protein